MRGFLKDAAVLQQKNSHLINEIGEIKQSYFDVGGDLNDVKRFLGMPIKNYLSVEDVMADQAADVDSNIEDVLYEYFNYLADEKLNQQKLSQNKLFLESLKNSKTLLAVLKEGALKISDVKDLSDKYTLSIDAVSGETIIFLELEKINGSLTLKTPKNSELLEIDTFAVLQGKIITIVEKEKDVLLAHVKAREIKIKAIIEAINSEKTKKVLDEGKFSIDSKYIQEDFKVKFAVLNKEKNEVGQVVLDTLDLKMYLIDSNNDKIEVADLEVSFEAFLKKLDNKTLIEKKADQALNELKSAVQSDELKNLLHENDLRIAGAPREDKLRIYFDIFDADGKHVSSLTLEKATGVINITDPDGSNSENLFYFDPEFKKKTLNLPENIPDYGNTLSQGEKAMNVLIAGKNGSLVDTLIFAHVNENDKTVKMVSVPRDLFYNGRKINSLVMLYGIEELKKALSTISGYQLDKYVMIDMYDFIDSIDMIGGIDISLKASVIDPSYKTIDNGVEGTLHYEPGNYHLGGVEALRLARSRKTSSDFVRADRQQMILKAIQNKAKNFGFGDAETVYLILKSFLQNAETDVSLDEAIKYYFKYQNYEIVSNEVISTANILYSPPYVPAEKCAALDKESEGYIECQSQNHSYYLLPKDENWNLIKWFFKQEFEE